MPSSLFGQQSAPRMQPQNNFAQLLNGAANPQSMAQNMLMANPNYADISKRIDACGGDARKAFFQMAKEKGMDPNSILSMAQQMLNPAGFKA